MTKRKLLPILYCALTAFVCLLICSKSSFLYPINDWTDANAYFSCGKGMLAGRVMYRDLYEHKGPLLYALHAVCCLFDSADFTAVFVLEVLAATAFLYACYQTLALYGAKRAAWLALPAIAAAVYSSFGFQQGDSAEELCLPLMAWSMYALLKQLREQPNRRMSSKRLLLHGALCGCVLWIKFTMLGLYGVWILGLFVLHARKRQWRDGFACIGWFALGVGIATLPWLVYFGANGAIVDWLKTYLYDNLFLYDEGGAVGLLAKGKAIAKAAWDWFANNLAYSLPIAVGFAAFTLRKDASKPEKWLVWLMLAFEALGVFFGGKSYVYYGLALAAFAPFGVLWLTHAVDALTQRLSGKAVAAVGLALTVAAGGVSLKTSINAPQLLTPRESTMQYRFAAIINETPNATLLNYGFMDAGFYTAANVVPSVKFFHQTNTQRQEMLDEQLRYIREGVTDYVVTRGRQPEWIEELYDCVSVIEATKGFWYDEVRLYRLKSLA